MSHVRAFGQRVLLWVAVLTSIGACVQERQVSYRTQVEPILQAHCKECHSLNGEGYKKSGFSVESYEQVMKGTKFGEVIVPGAAITSTLYLLITGKADPSISMPHGRKPLSEYDLKVIKTWIDQGAKNN
jgi:Planctomycete cytochrome C